MTLGVVIPVYRGKDTVGGVVESLYRLAQAQGLACRAVLVEDSATEANREAVRAVASRYRGVTCALNSRNIGQQEATYRGLSLLKDCDMIATMDEDGGHPAGLLPQMLAKLQEGYDLCCAVPSRAGYPLFRKGGALLRDALFSLCLHTPRGIRVSSYRVITGELAQKLNPEADGYFYLSAAAFQTKPRAACIYYEAEPSRPSSYTAVKLLRLYGGLLAHYTPLRAFFPKKPRPACQTEVLPGKGYLWQP